MYNFASLVPVEQEGQRVLLTSQLAEAYETTVKVISNNFNRNKERYIKGKHYFLLEGEVLKEFKATNQFEEQLKTTIPQFEESSIRINKLYLWTERGALLHAKSLNTDRAWEVYDYLVETYFRAKQQEFPAPAEKNAVDVAAEKRKLLEAKLHFLDLILPMWKSAGVPPEYQSLALSQVASEFGVHLPRTALQDTKVSYDKTTIADKIGILSSSGKPHALAVGAIIAQIDVLPYETVQTPYYRNGHDGVDIQYAESVIDKVRAWLEENEYPAQIEMPNGKKAFVRYR